MVADSHKRGIHKLKWTNKIPKENQTNNIHLTQIFLIYNTYLNIIKLIDAFKH